MFLHSESVEEIKLIRFSCIFIMGNSQASRDGDFSPECRYFQQNIATHTQRSKKVYRKI